MYDIYFFHLAISEFQKGDNLLFCKKCGEAYYNDLRKIQRCTCIFDRYEKRCFRGHYFVTKNNTDAYIIKIHNYKGIFFVRIKNLECEYEIPFYFNEMALERNRGSYCAKCKVYNIHEKKELDENQSEKVLEYLFPPFI